MTAPNNALPLAMSKIHKSKHVIEFEHLYKKGQKVYFARPKEDSSTTTTGTVEIIEFNPDNGSVCYFIKEEGWFEEDQLYKSVREVRLAKIKELEEQIAYARSEQFHLQRRLDTNKNYLKRLESSPWLTKATEKL